MKRDRHDLSSAERKQMPVHRGFSKYFPDAMMLVSMLSQRANAKHAPGQPIHWVKGASADHGDCLERHQMDIGEMDKEMGLDYAVHVAWRGMAQLQTLIEEHGMDALVDWDWEPLLPQMEVTEITSEHTESGKFTPAGDGFLLTGEELLRVGGERGVENPSLPVTPAEKALTRLAWSVGPEGLTARMTTYPGPDLDEDGKTI